MIKASTGWKLELKYTNNSHMFLDKLDFIYGRTYSTKSTHLQKQKSKQKSLKYHFAPITQMGNITELVLKWIRNKETYDSGHKNPWHGSLS